MAQTHIQSRASTLHAPSTTENVGWTFLIISVLSGATYSSFAKSLTTVFSPFSLLFVSEALTLFFLLFSFGVLPTLRQLTRIRQWMLVPLLVIGIFSGTLGPMLLFTGLAHTTAVNAVLFGNAELVFTLLLATIVLDEKWTPGRIIAVCFIIVGIVSIALEGFTTGIRLQVGDALILTASLCFSIGSITFRKYLRRTHPQISMLMRSFVAITIFFLLSPFHTHPFIEELESFTPALLPALIGFGFLSKFLNVFSFYQALEHLPVAVVSLFGTLGIVVAVAFSHMFLGEPILGYHVLGGALIIAGTVILELFGTQHNREHLRHRYHHRS